MAPIRIVTKPDKRSGIQCWAVTFTDRTNRACITGWTTHEGEAHAWADSIAVYGWCTSARPGPMVEI